MLYVPYRTTTVMQITEYNLLSQSTNVFIFSVFHPLAPRDQRVCSFSYLHIHKWDTIYRFFKLCFASVICVINMYACMILLFRCLWSYIIVQGVIVRTRWVSRSRLVTRVHHHAICNDFQSSTGNGHPFSFVSSHSLPIFPLCSTSTADEWKEEFWECNEHEMRWYHSTCSLGKCNVSCLKSEQLCKKPVWNRSIVDSPVIHWNSINRGGIFNSPWELCKKFSVMSKVS